MMKFLALLYAAWRLRVWPANALVLFAGFTMVSGRMEGESLALVASCALVGVVLLAAPDTFARRKGISL